MIVMCMWALATRQVFYWATHLNSRIKLVAGWVGECVLGEECFWNDLWIEGLAVGSLIVYPAYVNLWVGVLTITASQFAILKPRGLCFDPLLSEINLELKS